MALRYPEDATGFLGEIHFSPIITSLSSSNQLLNAGIEKGVAKTSGQNVEDVKSFGGSNGDTQNKSKQYIRKPNIANKCILYLPQAIQITDAATYTGVELGIVGAAAEGVLQRDPSAGNNISSFIDAMSGLVNADTAKLIANNIAKKASPAISGAVRSTTRVTINPNTRTLFESVPIREFMFSFKLIAHTQTEAETIKKIVKFFRTELYPDSPTTTVAEGIDINISYRFPNQFNIEMLYADRPVATKIKPCYLRNMSTTYNSVSAGMHADGNFNEVDISLSFVEEAALTRADIIDGGY